jgi:hypothetical protein
VRACGAGAAGLDTRRTRAALRQQALEYAEAVSDLEQVIEQLYAVPLARFTAERNASATALRKAGHRSDADRIQTLRKPSATLWVTNQLARTEDRRLGHFLDAVNQVRTTQLLDPRAASEAMQTQRADLDALVARAARLLTDAGQQPSTASLRRISNTLLGAAVDRRFADDLRHGRLTEELPAPGFEVLTGLAPAPQLRLVPGGKPPRGAEDSRQQEQHAREEEEERRRRAEEAARLEREAAERLNAVAALERELGDAEARLADVRRRLRDARAAAKNVTIRRSPS